jgi:excisionase family DNA binding protein
MSQEPLQELLTLKEASELLKVHPNTLRAWDKKGILKAIRIGERALRRYRKEDLMKFTEHKK